jgi:hypothetical protein
MSEIPTIRENVLSNLQTTLEAIKKTGGYNNDIASVQRWSQRAQTFASMPTIIINAGPEEKKPEPNPLATCTFNVYIDIWTNHLETDIRSSDEILNSLLGDTEKALMADITRGGNAIDTNILRNYPFQSIEGQPSIGISIEIEIIYQHQQTDPAISG